MLECLPASTGLVVRNCVELLAAKEAMASNGFQVSLSAKFIEIYEEQVDNFTYNYNFIRN